MKKLILFLCSIILCANLCGKISFENMHAKFFESKTVTNVKFKPLDTLNLRVLFHKENEREKFTSIALAKTVISMQPLIKKAINRGQSIEETQDAAEIISRLAVLSYLGICIAQSDLEEARAANSQSDIKQIEEIYEVFKKWLDLSTDCIDIFIEDDAFWIYAREFKKEFLK